MIIVAGLAAGVLLGLFFPGFIPKEYSLYVAVALLAAFDSIVGAGLAKLYNKFSANVFMSGFIVNTVLAVLLTFIGVKLDIDLYMAAVVVFGTRLFHNFAEIRRLLLNVIGKK